MATSNKPEDKKHDETGKDPKVGSDQPGGKPMPEKSDKPRDERGAK